MKNNVFREWVPAGRFVKFLVGFVSVLILFVLLLTVGSGVAFQNPLWIGVTTSVLIFVLFMFWNYRGIKIQVDEEKLVVDYGLFNRKSIQLTSINSCETVKASFKRYGGVGVRLSIDGSWAYTTSFGNAVKIVPKKGRTFIFSSSNPKKICKIINNYIKL
jgi:uncharacterized membrane protein YdbT with pleckstrin-like domain